MNGVVLSDFHNFQTVEDGGDDDDETSMFVALKPKKLQKKSSMDSDRGSRLSSVNDGVKPQIFQPAMEALRLDRPIGGGTEHEVVLLNSD
jgi:hypothetical protein